MQNGGRRAVPILGARRPNGAASFLKLAIRLVCALQKSWGFLCLYTITVGTHVFHLIAVGGPNQHLEPHSRLGSDSGNT